MQEVECNLNHFEIICNQFIANLNSERNTMSAIKKYELELLNVLHHLISNNAGQIDQYLMVTVGLALKTKLIQERKLKPTEQNQRCVNDSGILNLDDCQQVMSRLMVEYKDKLLTFSTGEGSSEINTDISPIDWLKLAEAKNLEVDDRINIATICGYYGLDQEIGSSKLKSPKTFNIAELAQKLGENERDALRFCLDETTIGIYVKNKIKEVNLFDSSDPYTNAVVSIKESLISPPQSRSFVEVQSAIEKGIVSTHHQYDYEDYVRLVKDGRRAFQHHMAVSLYKGDVIKINPKDELKLHLSLYDYIIGARKYLYSAKEIQITLDDLVFMEEEVQPFYETNRLNWDNFYSSTNASIVENLLERDHISIKHLSAIFSQKLTIEKTLAFFKGEFKRWYEEIENHKNGLDPFKEVLIHYNDKDKAISGSTIVKPLAAISMLMSASLLPGELKRLPRYTEKEIGFEPISDYYAEYDKQFFDSKSNGNLKEFTKLPINYIDDIPYTLTYDQLKKRWEDRNRPNNEIFKQCKNNKLGAYLEILESDVIIDCVINSANRLTFYRGLNCGNPFYLKRYKSLEKLIVEDKQRNFDLSNLTKKELLLKPHEHLLHPFETTDFERKFYITRTLKSFKGKNEIKKEDLVFLKEEVENIEKGWPPLESDEYLKEKNEKENVFQFTEKTMGMLEAAKKAKEQKKEWSKKGGDAQRKKAEKNWPPIFEIALKKIKEREKEGRCHNATSLAKSILNHITNHKLNLDFIPSESTLRRKLGPDIDISKYIKR